MEPDYFERLLDAFRMDPALGIASGSAWEMFEGVWRQRFVTGGTVWGATRAYRWTCLQDVLPLEARHGWDGVDQLKARARGWRTRTLTDLPFRHHRPEGYHDTSTWAHWLANGDTAYFMGYRFWYLVARTLHQMRRDPAAFGLVYGYLLAAARRSRRLDDAGARAVLRADQSFHQFFSRRREALGFQDRGAPGAMGSARRPRGGGGRAGPPTAVQLRSCGPTASRRRPHRERFRSAWSDRRSPRSDRRSDHRGRLRASQLADGGPSGSRTSDRR
jgi:hypothetical protein